jgi:hypothetical protein
MNQNWPLLTPCQMWLRQGEKQIEKLQTSMRICPAKNELTTCLLPCFGKTLGKSLSHAAVACKAKIGKLALFTCAWNEQQVSLPHEQKNSHGSTYWTTRLTILDVVVLVVGLMLNKPDIPVAQTGPSGFPCSTDTCSFSLHATHTKQQYETALHVRSWWYFWQYWTISQDMSLISMLLAGWCKIIGSTGIPTRNFRHERLCSV